jgi:hypothetical protein
VEFVWLGGKAQWTEPRCAVDHVVAINSTHTRVVMMQPCFYNLRYRGGGLCFFGEQSAPARVENVGAAAISAPWEWGLVTTGEKVFVHLAIAPGADISASNITMPRLETLASGEGVAHVRFTGIRFGYATWLRPGQGDGFVDFQG